MRTSLEVIMYRDKLVKKYKESSAQNPSSMLTMQLIGRVKLLVWLLGGKDELIDGERKCSEAVLQSSIETDGGGNQGKAVEKGEIDNQGEKIHSSEAQRQTESREADGREPIQYEFRKGRDSQQDWS